MFETTFVYFLSEYVYRTVLKKRIGYSRNVLCCSYEYSKEVLVILFHVSPGVILFKRPALLHIKLSNHILEIMARKAWLQAKLILVLPAVFIVWVVLTIQPNLMYLGDWSLQEKVVIAASACGTDRYEEIVVMIKSAILLSKPSTFIKFVLFSDGQSENLLTKSIKILEKEFFTSRQLEFLLLPSTFPSEKVVAWKQLFRPCASQRLFLSVSQKNRYD